MRRSLNDKSLVLGADTHRVKSVAKSDIDVSYKLTWPSGVENKGIGRGGKEIEG